MNDKIKKSELYNHFLDKGYVILRDIFTSQEIDDVVSDMNNSLEDTNRNFKIKKNPQIYHYNDSPRVIEGWRWSNAIRSLSINAHVLNFLRDFYELEPIPFSTINFFKATEQPLHSDELHFGSFPSGYLAGVWVALEDISPDAGPLMIAEKSHMDPVFFLEKINLNTPKSINELKENNTIYENYLRKRVEKMNYKIVSPRLNKGDTIVWSANLFHGSNKIINNNLTRYSQVTHYHFEKTDYYNPNYSKMSEKKYAYRNLDGNNILKEKINE